ncbi:glycoside hydrolase superfamily [Phellopilus nigrolimitatus]|nr:glycoside hydrolase superfamily [Phellopilus nigrolimitatus]
MLCFVFPVRRIILHDLASFFGATKNITYLFHDVSNTRLISSKWINIEPEQNLFNFTAADEIVRFAETVDADVRGHNFMWGNQLPTWVNTSLSATELDRALENHIITVMDHFHGTLYSWDGIVRLCQRAKCNKITWALTYARAEEFSIFSNKQKIGVLLGGVVGICTIGFATFLYLRRHRVVLQLREYEAHASPLVIPKATSHL